MSDESELAERVARLRSAFDASFAEPLANQNRRTLQILGVRASAMRMALRVDELAWLERCRSLVALPDAPAACLGLAGVRGKLLAVYSLAALVGGVQRGECRFLLVPRADLQIAFAFEDVEHCSSVDVQCVCARDVAADEPLVAVVDAREGKLPLVSVERLLQRVAAQVEAQP